MAWALLSVQTTDAGMPLPNSWRLFVASKERTEDIQMLTENLVLLRMPYSLPWLGKHVEAFDTCKVPYAIAFFEEKPEFVIKNG